MLDPFDMIVSGKRKRRQVERLSIASLRDEASTRRSSSNNNSNSNSNSNANKRRTSTLQEARASPTSVPMSPLAKKALKQAKAQDKHDNIKEDLEQDQQQTKKEKTQTKTKKDKSAESSSSATKKSRGNGKGQATSSALPEVEAQQLSRPFYEEDGSDWHGCDIDFDELSQLRAMWQLPAACHILWMLQSPLRIKVHTKLRDYEMALLKPQESHIMEDTMTKLLLDKSERLKLSPGIGLPYEWWNQHLREYFEQLYNKWSFLKKKAGIKSAVIKGAVDGEKYGIEKEESGEDEEDNESFDEDLSEEEWTLLSSLNRRLTPLGEQSPLKAKSFVDLNIQERVCLFLYICEGTAEDSIFSDHLRSMEEDDLRVDPLGMDRAGNTFYYFPQFYDDRRLYRACGSSGANGGDWRLWARGRESIKKMHEAICSLKRKHAKEVELKEHLESILAQLENESEYKKKMEEREQKRASLQSLPKKRSARLQVKQVEKFEEEQAKEEQEKMRRIREIEQARIDAEAAVIRKREEAKRKFELARSKEEENKLKEEQEKEFIRVQREERRLKRLQQEEEARLQLLQEEEMKKKLEAERLLDREMRAQRRLQGLLPFDSEDVEGIEDETVEKHDKSGAAIAQDTNSRTNGAVNQELLLSDDSDGRLHQTTETTNASPVVMQKVVLPLNPIPKINSSTLYPSSPQHPLHSYVHSTEEVNFNLNTSTKDSKEAILPEATLPVHVRSTTVQVEPHSFKENGSNKMSS